MNAPIQQQSSNALRTAYDELLRAAFIEAERAVERVRRAHPGRYIASRMNQKAVDHLSGVFRAAWPAAIETRFAQLDRINHKLARLDPSWNLKTSDEIRAAPAIYLFGERQS